MKQRYDSYKHSGIDWIGDIPSHWKVVPIKQICRSEKYAIKTGPFGSQLKGEDLQETGDIRVYNQRNVIDNNFSEVSSFVTSEKAKDLDSFYTLPNDLLVTSRGTIGKSAILPKSVEMGILHPCLIALRIDDRKANLKWVQRWINESEAFRTEIASKSNATTIDVIYTETLKNIRLALPPLAEQEAIAAWLDKKCEEIDAAIAKVDREIELIDELKQSEISRVVTRGLNPDVSLRPSGIDWIGDIPEHWTIRKTAQIFHGIGSGTTPTSGSNKYYSEDGVNWLQTGDLNDGNINNTSKKITTTALTDFSSLKIYPKGSIVIAMYGATIGKLGKLNIETTTNQACCVLPKSNEIDNDFAFYVFWAGKRALINSAYGGGQPNISQDTIKSFKLALPPLSEQQAIADYLDKKCAAIDGLKAKLTKKRETLTELRQSIISEVVTGKRKVI